MKLSPLARHPSTSSWVGAIWIVVACEVLWLLLMGGALKPADDHWVASVAHDELLMGSPPGPGRALGPLLALNIVVVVALWLAFVRERIALEPDGTYRRDVFAGPGAPLHVRDPEPPRAEQPSTPR